MRTGAWMDEARSLELIDKALSMSSADETEVVIEATHGGLTRFASNQIHQNMADANCTVNVRAVLGKKVGGASTNQVDDDSIRDVVARATSIAFAQRELQNFPGLPAPKPAPKVKAYFEATATATPDVRAELASRIIRAAEASNAIASGAVSTYSWLLAVGNSKGVRATFISTFASIHTVINADDGYGYASQTAIDISQIDAERVAERALQKALMSRKPVEAEPKEYTVILEEEAVADLMRMLAYCGLGAKAVQDGYSFMCNKFGERIMSESVTIYDDGLSSEGLPLPFDYEGVPKQRVVLIDRGIAKAVVYDTYTAAIDMTESTGHALLQPNPFGPYPINLFMDCGDATIEQMIESTDYGLLITRFHYTNVLHPKLTIITGMTRDGTFLIEGGKVKCGVRNLRFTESILKALSNVEAISSARKLCERIVAPAIKVTRFNFTGVTEF
ncbi:MAG: TldD/PmbA family protein [Armatimonadota bacterium]|nr:TldD/PmbA family protein [Armatimonadota bacterium]MCX7778268.1 TldD/PmbA family protein [Armatimonadota bacterium]MDW8026297.1 TldD/PmbA family protein [Armatimonadota bacterium]